MNTSEIVMVIVSAVNIIVVWVVMYVLCNVVTEECGKEPITPEPIIVHDSIVSDAGAALGIASWIALNHIRDAAADSIVVHSSCIDYYFGCCLVDRPDILNAVKNILEIDFSDIVNKVKLQDDGSIYVDFLDEYENNAI